MKNRILKIFTGFLSIIIVAFLGGCNSNTSGDKNSIPSDSASIAAGKVAFLQNCSSCHNFRQDGIGPQLGGITKLVSSDWIKGFIKSPKALVESGDERSKELLAHYKTLMPSFAHYSDAELGSIIAYLHTQKAPESVSSGINLPVVTNPIPQSIALSDVVAELHLATAIPRSSDKQPLTRVAKLDFIPQSKRLFIVDLRGKLYELRNNKPSVYLDMAGSKPKFINEPGLATGFGSFAFHPDFLENGLLYTTHTESPGAANADFNYADSIPVTVQWVISEWKAEQPTSSPFKGESRELFRINMVTGMHGVQEITFNPNARPGDNDYALLYIGIGDGASVEAGYPFLCHSTDKAWGSIFRIDPSGKSSANSQYGIPNINPFVKNSNSQSVKEIYAYGFRNPHRITWSKAGQMLATNIGQANIESVNLIMPGNDYGWPVREGTFQLDPRGDIKKVYALPEDDSMRNITYPAAQYDHDEGLAITGGFEYTGTAVSGLKGKYVFADMNNGRLFFIDLTTVKPGKQSVIKEWKISYQGKVTTLADLCGNTRVDLRIGRDEIGNIYLFSKQDGKVYRLAGERNLAL